MSQIINVIVVIDTASLIAAFPHPSQDQNNPTQIGHQYSYMVATAGSVISGQAGGDLNLKANVGDVIRWTGESESNNFESSVLVYGLPQYGGTQVFSNPVFKEFTKASMQPAQNGPFPVSFPNQTFWFIEADITNTGTEQYQVRFGVYNRPTGGAQQLFGYFQWDPTITVQS
jgi:hypothetical protein